MTEENKVPLSVRVEPEDMAVIDALVGEEKPYKNRSMAVRAAIRMLVEYHGANPAEAPS